MQILNWLNQNASAVNVLVLVAYAIFTLGIWRETQRSARRTEELARHSRKTLLLQALVAFLEQTRYAQEWINKPDYIPGSAWTSLLSLRAALEAAFPEEWSELCQALDAATDLWKRESGQPDS